MGKRNSISRRKRLAQKSRKRRENKRVVKKYKNTEDFLTHFLSTLPGLTKSFEGIYNDFACKEIQMVIMDLKSIEEHLVKLRDVGPSTPMQIKPLEESEQEVNPETDMPSGMRDALDENEKAIQESVGIPKEYLGEGDKPEGVTKEMMMEAKERLDNPPQPNISLANQMEAVENNLNED